MMLLEQAARFSDAQASLSRDEATSSVGAECPEFDSDVKSPLGLPLGPPPKFATQ